MKMFKLSIHMYQIAKEKKYSNLKYNFIYPLRILHIEYIVYFDHRKMLKDAQRPQCELKETNVLWDGKTLPVVT